MFKDWSFIININICFIFKDWLKQLIVICDNKYYMFIPECKNCKNTVKGQSDKALMIGFLSQNWRILWTVI